MAEPARKPMPEEAPQEAPKPEAPSGPMDLNEALTGRPTPQEPGEPWKPEGLSLREKENLAAERGHEILTGKKMEFDKEIEKNTSLFKETVSSWWNKTKSIFSRSKDKAGEEEIAKLETKAEALKADYAKKAETAVLPDNVIDLAAERAKREGAAAPKEIAADAGQESVTLKQKEAQLSAEYDRLAQEVAKEGGDESKAWKKALKTGEEPEMTAAGKKLNATYAELNRVRAELAKPEPSAEQAPMQAEPHAAEAAADAAEEEPFTPEELAELKAGGEKLAREKRIAEMGERVDAAMAAEDEQAAMGAVASLEKDAAAEKMAERQRQWDADKAEHERQRNEKLAAMGAANGTKTPRETYPNLPEPTPGSLPPGVPDGSQPTPEPGMPQPKKAPPAEPKKSEEKPAEKPKAKKERAPSKKKNAYDEQPLGSLKEHLAWRKERLTKPGRFKEGTAEKESEKKMIAQMEESVARREATEAPAQEAPAAEAPPAAPVEAAPEPEKEDELASMEFYEPHFGQIAAAFLKDPNIDPGASKTVMRKAKNLNALDLAKLLEGTGAFPPDKETGAASAPAIAHEFMQNPKLFEAARAKFVTEVEAALKKKP